MLSGLEYFYAKRLEIFTYPQMSKAVNQISFISVSILLQYFQIMIFVVIMITSVAAERVFSASPGSVCIQSARALIFLFCRSSGLLSDSISIESARALIFLFCRSPGLLSSSTSIEFARFLAAQISNCLDRWVSESKSSMLSIAVLHKLAETQRVQFYMKGVVLHERYGFT